MKTKILMYVCIAFTGLAVSCKPKGMQVNFDGFEEIVVDIDNAKGKFLPLDSFIKKVEYIKLETNDNCLIGMITQILFADSLLIIVDQHIAKSVYAFGMDGKFLFKIGNKGQGPGEYADITHVSIAPKTKNIVIDDYHRHLYFDYSGRYLYAEDEPEWGALYCEFTNSGNKAYNKFKTPNLKGFKYNDNILMVTDPENNIIYGDLTDFYNMEKFTCGILSPLRRCGEELYFTPSFLNKIYRVEDDKVVPLYYINFKSNGLPPLDENITNEIHQENQKKSYVFNGDFIELKDLTFFNVMIPTGYPFAVYSHAKKTVYYESAVWDYPLCGCLHNQEPLARYGDNAVVNYVQTYSLLEALKRIGKDNKYRKEMDVLSEGLTAESNPLIMIYHLNPKLGF